METLTSAGLLKDLSGKGNDGVLSGTTNMSGKVGNARSFNGVSDYMDIGTSSLIGSGSAPFTTSFWIYSTKDLTQLGSYSMPLRLKQSTEFFFTLYHYNNGQYYINSVFRGATQWGIPIDYP